MLCSDPVMRPGFLTSDLWRKVTKRQQKKKKKPRITSCWSLCSNVFAFHALIPLLSAVTAYPGPNLSLSTSGCHTGAVCDKLGRKKKEQGQFVRFSQDVQGVRRENYRERRGGGTMEGRAGSRVQQAAFRNDGI